MAVVKPVKKPVVVSDKAAKAIVPRPILKSEQPQQVEGEDSPRPRPRQLPRMQGLGGIPPSANDYISRIYGEASLLNSALNDEVVQRFPEQGSSQVKPDYHFGTKEVKPSKWTFEGTPATLEDAVLDAAFYGMSSGKTEGKFYHVPVEDMQYSPAKKFLQDLGIWDDRVVVSADGVKLKPFNPDITIAYDPGQLSGRGGLNIRRDPSPSRRGRFITSLDLVSRQPVARRIGGDRQTFRGNDQFNWTGNRTDLIPEGRPFYEDWEFREKYPLSARARFAYQNDSYGTQDTGTELLSAKMEPRSDHYGEMDELVGGASLKGGDTERSLMYLVDQDPVSNGAPVFERKDLFKGSDFEDYAQNSQEALDSQALEIETDVPTVLKSSGDIDLDRSDLSPEEIQTLIQASTTLPELKEALLIGRGWKLPRDLSLDDYRGDSSGLQVLIDQNDLEIAPGRESYRVVNNQKVHADNPKTRAVYDSTADSANAGMGIGLASPQTNAAYNAEHVSRVRGARSVDPNALLAPPVPVGPADLPMRSNEGDLPAEALVFKGVKPDFEGFADVSSQVDYSGSSTPHGGRKLSETQEFIVAPDGTLDNARTKSRTVPSGEFLAKVNQSRKEIFDQLSDYGADSGIAHMVARINPDNIKGVTFSNADPTTFVDETGAYKSDAVAGANLGDQIRRDTVLHGRGANRNFAAMPSPIADERILGDVALYSTVPVAESQAPGGFADLDGRGFQTSRPMWNDRTRQVEQVMDVTMTNTDIQGRMIELETQKEIEKKKLRFAAEEAYRNGLRIPDGRGGHLLPDRFYREPGSGTMESAYDRRKRELGIPEGQEIETLYDVSQQIHPLVQPGKRRFNAIDPVYFDSRPIVERLASLPVGLVRQGHTTADIKEKVKHGREILDRLFTPRSTIYEPTGLSIDNLGDRGRYVMTVLNNDGTASSSVRYMTEDQAMQTRQALGKMGIQEVQPNYDPRAQGPRIMTPGESDYWKTHRNTGKPELVGRDDFFGLSNQLRSGEINQRQFDRGIRDEFERYGNAIINDPLTRLQPMYRENLPEAADAEIQLPSQEQMAYANGLQPKSISRSAAPGEVMMRQPKASEDMDVYQGGNRVQASANDVARARRRVYSDQDELPESSFDAMSQEEIDAKRFEFEQAAALRKQQLDSTRKQQAGQQKVGNSTPQEKTAQQLREEAEDRIAAAKYLARFQR